jgi:hypothetical protein
MPVDDVEPVTVPVAARLERAPAAVVELGPNGHLGPAHLIKRYVRQRDNVARIDADRRLRRDNTKRVVHRPRRCETQPRA